MISQLLTGLGDPVPYFNIAVTNVGAGTRFIKNPVFYFDHEKNGRGKNGKRFQSVDVQNPTKFPVELQVGKELTSSVEIGNFVSSFAGQIGPREKVRIEVTDTHGKRYLSKKSVCKQSRERLMRPLVLANRARIEDVCHLYKNMIWQD